MPGDGDDALAHEDALKAAVTATRPVAMLDLGLHDVGQRVSGVRGHIRG